MKTTIYYFTGTGNGLDVARDLQQFLGETDLVFIPSAMKNVHIKPPTEQVGFVFPVYYYGVPLLVRDFIDKLDVTDAAYLFSVVTCKFIPGLALEQLNKRLRGKGKKLHSGFVINMPGNYVPLYGPDSQKTQEKKFKRKTEKIGWIAECIKNRSERRLEKSRWIIGRFLAPYLQKYIDQCNRMDRYFWVDEKCNGCGICHMICAFDNISMIEGKPEWLHRCQQCLACLQWCPRTSIQYGKTTIHRKRYRNPHVTLKDLLDQNNER